MRRLLCFLYLCTVARAQGEDNKNYYWQNNNQQSNDSDGNFFSTLADRIWDDVLEMWTSSPSEWALEYWEVFAVMAAIVFLVVGCHCVMCLDVCCYGGGAGGDAGAGGRKTMTEAELKQKQQEYTPPSIKTTEKLLEMETDESPENPKAYAPPSMRNRAAADAKSTDSAKQQQQKDQPQHSQEDKPPQTQDPPAIASAASPPAASAVSTIDPVLSPTQHTNSEDWKSTSTEAPTIEKVGTAKSHELKRSAKKKKQNSLMREVVSVWSEFLGFSKEEDLYYHRHEDRKQRKQRKHHRGHEIV